MVLIECRLARSRLLADEKRRWMDKKTGQRAVWCQVWLGFMAVLVCYGLSAGPVIRLYVHTQNPVFGRTLAMVYLPLSVLEDTPAGTALGGWIRWCCELRLS
jgi:hypothetical protein